MAEAIFEDIEEEDPPGDDVDIDPVKGLPLFEFLDEGNLVDKIDDTAFTVQETLRLLDDAEQSMSKWKTKYKKAMDLAKLKPESAQTLRADLSVWLRCRHPGCGQS